MLWQDFVPLRRLLPQAAALIHHGGIGTTAEALRAGTPQLVVPLAHDQFDNAARVTALGVGAALPAARLDEQRLVRRLGALLAAPGLATRTRAVAARFTPQTGVDRMCAALDDLAR
jgi:rhamnosyltransferase subunit B